MGTNTSVSGIIKEKILVTLPTLSQKDLKVEVRYDTPLQAPVKKDQKIGTLIVNVPRIEPLEYPLYAKETVKEIGFISKTIAKAKLFFGQGA